MAFDVAIGFTVETKELINARNALQSLAQTAKDLNSNQEKAAKAADSLVEANKKIAETSDAAAKATEKSEKAAKSFAGEGDAAASKLSKLKDQLSFLRDDLNLSEVGFTKSQAGVLAWAKSVGASSGIIKEFASTFDNLNKVSGVNPFDQSAKGLSSLNSELRELKQVQSLAADGIGLTAKQVQMLSRDLEGIRQQNEAFGRSAEEGVQKHRAAFIEAASSVNSYKEQVKLAQRETENLFQAEQELARNRKLVNDELIKGWGAGIGKKSQALSDLAAQYSEEERLAVAHQAKMQQINSTAGNAAADEYYRRQAAASKIAADAIDQLERDTRKLITTNEYLDRGFTSSSANALFRYKEALQATGVSAIELKQKLYLLEQDLMKRQNTSPFARMREDVKKVTEQTGHLARAISVQLGDVAISLAGGQNPFVVLLQQGDQIRGAVQQAVDAGQKIDQALKGAFVSMANSAKLVGVVIKEFAMDGLRSVSDALQVVGKYTTEVNAINKRYEDGTISLTRSQRLLTVQSLLLDKAMGTLRIVALGTAAVFGGILLKAFYDLSKEQDNLAKSNAQFGAMFGATTQEAVAMTKSLMDVGISSSVARTALEAMQKTGSLTKDSFTGIATAAAEAQKYVGISVEETVKKFGEIAKDPVRVLSEFTQETGFLSQAQLQLVRDLVEAGNGAEAQRVAIKLLEDGYKSMSAQAQADMSETGKATVELTSATSTLWDTFKNSSVAEVALKGVKVVIDVLAVSAHALVSVVRDLAITAGFAIDLASGGPRSVSDKWNTYTQALADNSKNHEVFAETLIKGAKAQEVFTAEQRKLNASNEQVSESLDKMNKSNEEHSKKLVKDLDIRTYVGKRIMEENKELTKNFTDDQKKAFYSSEQYKSQILASEKRFQKEWQDAHKKREGKPKETYQVNRDNELQETKKFYDAQLKQLKDFESKQSQINKAAFDSKAISYGEYVAKEIELVTSSQQQQLSIIEKSEAAYRANIESRKKAQESAAASAIKGGANSSKINEKLSQELKNLSNESRTAEEGFKGLRSALENSANAKYAVFYKELAKSLYDSNEELKKFSKTVEDNARRRKEDLALETELLGVYGAGADALKASTSTMRGYEGAIDSANKKLEEAVKNRKDLEGKLSTVVGVEAYNKLNDLVEKSRETENQLRLNAIETEKKARIDANQAGADAALAYNLKTFKEMRDSLSESIYDALFEGGKSGGDALKNVLKKMFKNYVINVLINPITNGIAGSVLGAFGIGGGGGSSASSGIGGSISNLSSLYSAFSGGLTSSIGGAIATLGTTFGSSALTSIAAGIKGSTLAAGLAGPTTAGASGLVGLGSTLGAAMPWIAGGLALVSLLGSGLFKGNSGTPHVGGASVYSGGQATQGWLPDGQRVQSGQDFTDSIAKSFGSVLDGAAKIFGKTAGYSFSTTLLDDSSPDGAFGGLQIRDAFGSIVADWGNYDPSWGGRWFSDGEQGVKEFLNATAVEVKNAIVGMGIPEWAKQILSTAKDVDTLNAALQQIASVKTVFEALGNTVKGFSQVSDEFMISLIGAFGSVQGLVDVTSSYYENFYTDAEKVAKVTSDVSNALKGVGLEMPTTREEFRKLVESQLALGDSGAKAVAVLLGVSEAFASVTEGTAKTVEEALAGLRNASRSSEDIAQNIIRLEQALFEAQNAGNTEALRDKTLQNLTEQERILQKQLWIIEDTKSAQDKLISAYKEQVNALDSSISRLRTYADSLRKFKDSLTLGDLSPLTPGEQYAEAKRQYENTLAKAMVGDVDAQNALQGAITSFLQASKTYNASGSQYTSDFLAAQKGLEFIADIAQDKSNNEQIIRDAAVSQLELLGSIDDSVLSVGEKISASLIELSNILLTGKSSGLIPDKGVQDAVNNGLLAGTGSTYLGSLPSGEAVVAQPAGQPATPRPVAVTPLNQNISTQSNLQELVVLNTQLVEEVKNLTEQVVVLRSERHQDTQVQTQILATATVEAGDSVASAINNSTYTQQVINGAKLN